MRKFKLIKEYPGFYGELGGIAKNEEFDSFKYEWKHGRTDTFHLTYFTSYPEFWQEIKEYPKIISFRKKFGNREVYKVNESGVFTDYKESFGYNYLLEHHLFEIYQVATSPTEIFTVGDKVNYYGENCKIIRFYFNEHKQLSFEVNAKKASTPKTGVFGSDEKYNYLKKAPTPLFTTEDNFEIVDVLTRVYVVWNNKLTISNERFWDVQIPAEMKECKVFYNKESAEKFVDKNKPRFSVKDVEDALTMNWGRTTGDTIGNVLVLDEEKFRQKLGI